jgi:DNA-binding NarL/FixJ family response regulator
MAKSSQIKIGIADDERLVREGLAALLGMEESLTVVFEAENGQQLIELSKKHLPDVVLVDMEMPIVSGDEAVAILAKELPTIRPIMVSTYFVRPLVVKALKNGAKSFLPKGCGIRKLLQAIHAVSNQGYFLDDELIAMLGNEINSLDFQPFVGIKEIEWTDTELNIIRLLCDGKSSKEIGALMNLTESTINYHRPKIMAKVGVKHTAALIIYAVKNNLL